MEKLLCSKIFVSIQELLSKSETILIEKLIGSSLYILPQISLDSYLSASYESDKKIVDHLIAEGDNFLSQFFVEEAIDSYNKNNSIYLNDFLEEITRNFL